MAVSIAGAWEGSIAGAWEGKASRYPRVISDGLDCPANAEKPGAQGD